LHITRRKTRDNLFNGRLCAEEHERERQKHGGDSEHKLAGKRRARRTGERTSEDQGAKGKHDDLIKRDVERGPVGQHDGRGRIREEDERPGFIETAKVRAVAKVLRLRGVMHQILARRRGEQSGGTDYT